jgi:hypothetical protein
LQDGEGFARPVQLLQHHAEIVERVGMALVEVQRAAERAYRVRIILLLRQHDAEVAPRAGVGGVDGDRPRHEVVGRAQVPHLVRNEAAVVERRGVVGVFRQQRGVQL